MSAITLPTLSGSVELREAREPRRCAGGCGVTGGGLLDVNAKRGEDGVELAICGTCLSNALGLYLRVKRSKGER